MIHDVLKYQSNDPNNPKQVQCKAVQNAVQVHDAMIVSCSTGTAGPMMGTMHNPQVKGEMKEEMTNTMQNNTMKGNTGFVITEGNM